MNILAQLRSESQKVESEVSSLDSINITRRNASNLIKQAYHNLKRTNPEAYEEVKAKKRRSRFWNRAKTGEKILKSQKRTNWSFKFLTLTSSHDSGDISQDWDTLRKRLERFWHIRSFPYIKVAEYNKSGDLVHLHIIMYSPFIEIEDLRNFWYEIHQAYEIFITRIDESDIDKNLGYLGKYLTKQMTRRFSYSRSWAGYMPIAKLWHAAVKYHFQMKMEFSMLISTWEEFIMAEHVPKRFDTLYDFMIISTW